MNYEVSEVRKSQTSNEIMFQLIQPITATTCPPCQSSGGLILWDLINDLGENPGFSGTCQPTYTQETSVLDRTPLCCCSPGEWSFSDILAYSSQYDSCLSLILFILPFLISIDIW